MQSALLPLIPRSHSFLYRSLRFGFATSRSCPVQGMFCALFLTGILLAGCSGKDGTKPPTPPARPPGAVVDLRADSVSSRSLVLRWTAPPADGDSGRAARYDLRYAPLPDSGAEWWASATRLAAAVPESAGTGERLRVSDLVPQSAYVFALKAAGADSSWSELSNVLTVSCPALPDTIPPAAVRDLTVDFRGSTVITLVWTAPGDDGITGRAARYDVRYSVSALTDSTWSAADTVAVTGLPAFPEANERLAVRGLVPETRYHFGVKAVDEAGNASALHLIVTGTTSAHATYLVPTPDFPEIPSALSATVAGDTVMVEPGTYPGGIVVPDHRVLIGRGGRESTFLDSASGAAAVAVEDSCVLEGLTVRGPLQGSGIECRGASVTLRGCRVENCVLGYGLRSGCRAEDCHAAECGTAFGVADGEGFAVLAHCLAERNWIGIQAMSDVRVQDSILRENDTGADLGPENELEGCLILDNTNAGIRLQRTRPGKTVLRYCTVSENGKTDRSRGGITALCDSLVIEGCTVAGNRSISGGGGLVLDSEGAALVTRSSFIDNYSGGEGGGIFVDRGALVLAECIIAGNSAYRDGGGICASGPVAIRGCVITGNLSGESGGGVFTQGLLGLTSCTIAGNRAHARAGGITLRDGDLTMERCILFGNCAGSSASDAELDEGARLTLICSAYRTTAINTDGSGTLHLSGDQVETDPLFVSPISCEAAPTHQGDWHLKSGSPCLPVLSPCGVLIGAEEPLGR